MASFRSSSCGLMRGFCISPLLGALCLSLVVLQLLLILNSDQAILELGQGADTRLWFNVLRLDNNSYHRWLVDPIVYSISLIFSPLGAEKSILWTVQLTVLALGIFNLLRIKDKFKLAELGSTKGGPGGMLYQTVSSLLIAGVIGIIAPIDVVSLGSICWLPLLVSLIYALKLDLNLVNSSSDVSRFRAISIFLLITVATFMHLFSSSFLAPLTALLFAGALRGFNSSAPLAGTDLSTSGVTPTFRRLIYVTGLLSVGLWIVLIWGGASAELPDYPADAVVVPDDGVPGITRPLSSSDYRLMVSHPFLLRNTWGVTAVSLTFLLVIWLLELLLQRICRKKRDLQPLQSEAYLNKGESCQEVKLLLLLSLLCFLDLYLPAQIREISPLSSLSRVYPGAFLIPLVPIFISLNILVLLINLLSSTVKFPSARFFCFTALLATLPLATRPELKSCNLLADTSPPISKDPEIVQHQIDMKKVCQSPSRWLVDNYGTRIVSGYRKAPLLHSGPLPVKEAVSFNSSSSQRSANTSEELAQRDLALVLTDHHNNTRWGSANNGQHGNEWLRLDLSETSPLDGILLATGDFKSDFPAGLRVDCITDDSKIIEAFRVDEWQGPVYFTGSGYPYFGAPSDVRLIFPETLRCRSLIIYQTGKRSLLDWSVAEVRSLQAIH